MDANEILGCIQAGDAARLGSLLEEDATLLTVFDQQGYTPLHQAVRYNRLNVVRLLLDRGMDPNIRSRYGQTPLHCASSTPVADVISQGYVLDIGKAISAGQNPRQLDLSIPNLLLARGADVNARTERGITPLHDATTVEQASILIEQGADANARDNDGDTPLHLIHRSPIIQLLLDSGADPNSLTDGGRSAVISQVISETSGSDEVIEVLVKAGADPRAADKFGRTALHFMGFHRVAPESPAARGQIRIACALLFNGADLNAQTTADSVWHVHQTVGSQVIKVRLDIPAGSTPKDTARLGDSDFVLDLIDRYAAGGDKILKRLLKDSETYPTEAEIFAQFLGQTNTNPTRQESLDSLRPRVVGQPAERVRRGRKAAPTPSSKSLKAGSMQASYRDIDSQKAAKLNAEYQVELERWKALPWWKRFLSGRPIRPDGI